MTNTLKGMVSAFLSTRRLRNLSPISFYSQYPNKFLEFMESHYPDVSLKQIDHSVLREYVSGLKEKHSAGGVNHHIKIQKILFKLMVEEGVLFLTKFGDPLTLRMTNKIIERIGEKAKVKNIRLSAYTFRHTFAKNWLVSGGDIFSLQKILGHRTLDMDRNYVNITFKDIQSQCSKFGQRIISFMSSSIQHE